MNLTSVQSATASLDKYWTCARNNYTQNKMENSLFSERQEEKAKKTEKMRSLIRDANKAKNSQPTSVVESTLSYGEQLRSSRMQGKSTTNELKKLKYSFKNISSQIRRAKSSVSAKQVVSKARREVLQLKAKLQTGDYDKEELQAAIEHAKSMERAAKKKARHLEEEELIKITDNSTGEGMVVSDIEQEMEDENEKELAEYEESLLESIDELAADTGENIEESSEEMMDLISDAIDEMEDMMSETLENLMDGMMVITDYEMTEDEYKVLITKHRNSEEKSMVEADAKYLKEMFDMLSRKSGDGSISLGNNVSTPVAMINGYDNIQNIVDFSV